MSKQFAEFLMGDLFTVENGKKHPVKDRVDGDMPLVSTSSLCRGISQYITVPNEKGFKTHKNVLTIAYSGSVGETFYHPYEVFVGETVMTLLLKEEFGTLNNLRGQYLQTVIRKKMNRYSYSSKVKISDVRNTLTITLPVTDVSAGTDSPEPDWEYMEEYIKGIEAKYLDDVVKYNKRNGEILDTLYPDYNGSAPEAYDYAEFRVTDIFEIKNGVRLKSDDHIPGSTPYISAREGNNGISNWVANSNSSLDSDLLGVNYNGNVLEAYYHPYEAIFSDDVKRFKIKNEKPTYRMYIYVATAIKKLKKAYSYTKKFNSSEISKVTITLPVTDESAGTESPEPDWEYMENYIKGIEKQERENRALRAAQEEHILKQLASRT